MTVPRVTTRGYYDRTTGAALNDKRYNTHPPGLAGRLAGSAEIAVMVHGMRNDSAAAASKIRTAAERLAELGYGHPVIGYSYDSNVRGAHIRGNLARTLKTAHAIASKNGRNLAWFVSDFADCSPDTKMRLLGHSLGSEVIMSAILHLHEWNRGAALESVHLFGASIKRRCIREAEIAAMDATVRSRLLNHYWPDDEVLRVGHESGIDPDPVGLVGVDARIPKWNDVRVRPRNHRFASYAPEMRSFP